MTDDIKALMVGIGHAKEQVDSISEGIAARAEKLKQHRATLVAQYGDDVPNITALSCAIGANEDARIDMRRSANALDQEYDHLLSMLPNSGS